MNRRKQRFLILFLAVTSLFVPQAGAEKNRHTLRLRYWQAPVMLNPHLSAGIKDLEACRIAYEPLASYDRDGTLIPFLAAEIPSLKNGGVAADGKSVTWKLKKGVKWSDGMPFSSRDVRFTYDFIMNPDTAATTAPSYEMIEEIETPDDSTVIIHFRNKSPVWAVPFVGSQGMIIPRHIFSDFNSAEAHSAPANHKPVGTGPYQAALYRKEDMVLIGEDLVSFIRIHYVRNPHYRGPSPGFRRLELLGGGDADTAARAVFMEETADYAWNLHVGSEILDAMKKNRSAQITVIPTSHVERIILNRADPNRVTETGERSSIRFPHPFFKDINIRKAFAHAVDRRAVAALYKGYGEICENLIVSPSRYRSDNTAGMYSYDLKKAAALLDKAGWKDTDGDGWRDRNGVKMHVLYQTSLNPTRQGVQNIIKDRLSKIGVDVELKGIDGSIFFNGSPSETNNMNHFYADMQQYAFGNQNPDPEDYLRFFTCDSIMEGAQGWSDNDARWCHPEFDTLMKAVSEELDPEKRKALFIRMNDLIIEDAVLIPLVSRGILLGTGSRLKGVDVTPWDLSTWKIAEWRWEQADSE